jgi:hypothetical protein
MSIDVPGLISSPPPPKLQAALAELSVKSLRDIQRATAETWAYRARAARIYAEAVFQQGEPGVALRWKLDATEYEHEAIEHAALCGDDAVLAWVRRVVSDG